MEFNTYIKVTPETDVDKEVLRFLTEQPAEIENLEEYISLTANSNPEDVIYTNYKGINLILERVTMVES